MTAVNTILLVSLGIAVFFGIAIAIQSRLRKRALEIMKRYENHGILRISSRCNFFGVESSGRGQVRGNGVILLTRKEIYFEMFLPRKSLTIPLSTITGVEVPRSHLAKTKFQPLLKVRFINENGQPDSAAWLIGELERWVELISDTAGIDGDGQGMP